MSLVSVKMNGLETLERKLSEMNSIRFDAVVNNQMIMRCQGLSLCMMQLWDS